MIQHLVKCEGTGCQHDFKFDPKPVTCLGFVSDPLRYEEPALPNGWMRLATKTACIFSSATHTHHFCSYECLFNWTADQITTPDCKSEVQS